MLELRETLKFRVRILEFGENFRGNANFICCPLCASHLDNQNMLFQCPLLKNMEVPHADIEKIYTDNTDAETIKELSRLLRIRKNLMESGQE